MDEKYVTDSLLVISEKSTKELIIEGKANAINDFYSDFFKVIALKIENNKVILDSPFIQITEDKKNKIAKLAEIWKDKDVHIFQLKKFFDCIPVGNYISVLPKRNLTTELNIYIIGALHRLNAGSSIDEVLNNIEDISNFKTLFSDLLTKYTVEVADCNTSYIGENIKKRRVCRFCGKSMPEVTFKKTAHAIPEGLGNKTVFDNEECDSCNMRFGSGLDNELIDYFTFYRGIFGIKGKKGRVKNKFKDGYITENENGIVIASQNIEFGKDDKPESVEFTSEKKLIHQNIYKALARISLGTVKNFSKEIYEETIKWINNKDFYYNSLPKVAFMYGSAMYTERPDIINYILKTDEDLPFMISELHLKFLVFVYIVPVKKNDFSFISSEKYKTFWDNFKHYSKTHWTFLDFSSKEPTSIKYRMSFIERQG